MRSLFRTVSITPTYLFEFCDVVEVMSPADHVSYARHLEDSTVSSFKLQG